MWHRLLPRFAQRNGYRRSSQRLWKLLGFRFQNPAPNVQVALRKWNLDAGFAQFFFDGEIEIAFEPARAMAHLAAPDDQLEIDRAFSEFVQEHARRRIFQDVGITPAGGDERFADFVDVAAVSYPDRNPEPDPRIAVGPVRHGRIDELRVRHNHG